VISGVILAGGDGTRIGGDKAMRLLGGRPLVQWAVEGLERVVDDIVISLAPGQRPPPVRARVPAVACVDLLPARGPLTGIYTGLDASRADHVVVVPCDAPFVEPGLLELLMARRGGWDAVVPQVGRLSHATIGVYARSCLPALVDTLNGADLSLRSFLLRVQTCIVAEQDVREADPDLRSFFNVNRLADLCCGESMLAGLAAT
jgi:molybdopterin-guanine dinucleotide biosynthesis protein A